MIGFSCAPRVLYLLRCAFSFERILPYLSSCRACVWCQTDSVRTVRGGVLSTFAVRYECRRGSIGYSRQETLGATQVTQVFSAFHSLLSCTKPVVFSCTRCRRGANLLSVLASLVPLFLILPRKFFYPWMERFFFFVGSILFECVCARLCPYVFGNRSRRKVARSKLCSARLL